MESAAEYFEETEYSEDKPRVFRRLSFSSEESIKDKATDFVTYQQFKEGKVAFLKDYLILDKTNLIKKRKKALNMTETPDFYNPGNTLSSVLLNFCKPVTVTDEQEAENYAEHKAVQFSCNIHWALTDSLNPDECFFKLHEWTAYHLPKLPPPVKSKSFKGREPALNTMICEIGQNGWWNPMHNVWEWYADMTSAILSEIAPAANTWKLFVDFLDGGKKLMHLKKPQSINPYAEELAKQKALMDEQKRLLDLELLKKDTFSKMAGGSIDDLLTKNEKTMRTMSIACYEGKTKLTAIRNGKKMGTPTEVMSIITSTESIPIEALMSAISLMTGISFLETIKTHCEDVIYRGFNVSAFAQQIFMALLKHHDATFNEQDFEVLRPNEDIMNRTISDLLLLIALFLVRGTSIISDQKNISSEAAEKIKQLIAALEIKPKMGALKDTKKKQIVTLPRICSAFPGHAMMILKLNGHNVDRPVSIDTLQMNCIPDYPKTWTSNVIFGILPYPNGEETGKFGNMCKTLLAYGYLESEIINQKDADYKKKTTGEKFQQIMQFAKAAFSSSGANKTDREKVFFENCLPFPVPNNKLFILIRSGIKTV